ncbi:MAG: acyltransferase family protein [Clostridiales bacterium]|jgi:peptidoglycan/LPS O-acetylase OafA/YrhL|nr:acyltransferase family protein [Clostridiales bacterium]
MAQMTGEKSAKQKNAIIELLRFIFALWVVKHHLYFPIDTGEFFLDGFLAVEFFFILSGYLFIPIVLKYDKMESLIKTFPKYLFHRIKGFGLPFLIGVGFSTYYMIISKGDDWLGFQWFIVSLLLALSVFFIVYRFIKKPWQWTIVALICIAVYFGVRFGIGGDRGEGAAYYLRAFYCVSCGICVFYLPKIQNDLKLKKLIIPLFIFIFLAVIALMALKKNLAMQYILISLFFPLVYLGFQIEIKNPYVKQFFIYLGSLSFGLYMFQNVVRIPEFYGKDIPTLYEFLVILTMSMCFSKISPFYKKKKTNGLDARIER